MPAGLEEMCEAVQTDEKRVRGELRDMAAGMGRALRSILLRVDLGIVLFIVYGFLEGIWSFGPATLRYATYVIVVLVSLSVHLVAVRLRKHAGRSAVSSFDWAFVMLVVLIVTVGSIAVVLRR
jgi:hypothetical protein